MSVQILKTVFLLFTFFYCLHCATENRCRKCPNLTNITDAQPSYKDNCPCENAQFFDEDSNACVRFTNCTDVKKIQEEISSSTKELFKKGPEGIKALIEGDINEIISNFLHKVFDPKQIDQLEQSKDYDIFTDVIEEELGSVVHKYSSTFATLFNPFVRKSKALTAKCGNDQGCAFQYLLEKNERRIKKIIKNLGPDFLKALESVETSLKEIVNDECEHNECVIIKKAMVVLKGLKEEIVNEFKVLSDYIVKMVTEHSFSEYFNQTE